MSATARIIESLRALLWHPLGDWRSRHGDYDRLVVIDSGPRGYDVVLRIDGGYCHPADADSARGRWQRHLDAALADLGRADR